MALKLDEKTEIQVSLKTVIALIVAIVAASAFVFHIEERIDFLESKDQRQSHSDGGQHTI
jgi:hypothetical protein